jgi:hypothetical protein
MLLLALDALAQHGTLTDLDLSYCPDLFTPAIEPSLLAVLPQFAAGDTLRTLAMSNCDTQLETDDAVARAVGPAAHVRLRELDEGLPRCGVRASWAQAVVSLEHNAWQTAFGDGVLGVAVLGARRGAACVLRCVEFSAPRHNAACTVSLRLERTWRGEAARGAWRLAPGAPPEVTPLPEGAASHATAVAAALLRATSAAFSDGADVVAPRRVLRRGDGLQRCRWSRLPTLGVGGTAAMALRAVRDAEALLARNEAVGGSGHSFALRWRDDAEEDDSEHSEEEYDDELVVTECVAQPPGGPLPACREVPRAPPRAPVDTRVAPDWLAPGALCAAWRRAHACRGCAALQREERAV